MLTIGSRQASNSFGSLLDIVQRGEPVKVTRNHNMERKRLELLAELQKGIDELDSNQYKKATPEFWDKLKKSVIS